MAAPSLELELREALLAQARPNDALPMAPANALRPLTEDEVESIVSQEIQDALNYHGSEIAELRRKSLQYYYGKPFGNEQDGKSQAVLTDLKDTVEWMLPYVLDMLAGTGRIWTFEPAGGTMSNLADESARQANETVNHLFLNEMGDDSPSGWYVLYEWIKTCLIEPGATVARSSFDERYEPERVTYRGKTREEVEFIVADDTVEIIGLTEHEGDQSLVGMDGRPVPTYDVETVCVKSIGKLKVEAIPPEEFLISRDSRYLNDRTRFCGHHTRVTVSDLVAMGFRYEDVADLPSDDLPEWDSEFTERRSDDEGFRFDTDRPDGASRQLWLTDCCMRIDVDGDGYAELRRLLVAGTTGCKVLLNEPISHNPYSSICSVPMPFKFHGLSMGELVMDLQLIRSTLLRQGLDNIYHANSRRPIVQEGGVDMDSVMDEAPGEPIIEYVPGAYREREHVAMPPHAMQMLQFTESVKENRTGVGGWMSGPTPQSLKNVNTGAASEAITQATQKIAMVARIIAETGLKDLGKKLYRLQVENATAPITYKIRGRYVTVDPTKWAKHLNCRCEVGLSPGQSATRVQHLTMLAQWQKDALAGGLGGLLVTPQNLYHTGMALQEAMSLRYDDRFFTDPGNQPFPQPEPPLEDQVKVAESQRRSKEDQMQHEQKSVALAVEADNNEKLNEFRYAELLSKNALERERIRADAETRIQIAQMQITAARARSSQGGE